MKTSSLPWPVHFSLAFLSGILLGFLVQFWSVPAYSAPEENPRAPACVREYYSFLSQVRTPAESKLAWRDFFRPYCQVVDILKLEDELDALRSQFLDRSMACADTTSERRRYNELVMELYFVRSAHNLDSSSVQSREAADPQSIQDARMAQLRTEMLTLFVKQEKRLAEAEFETLFDAWLIKYSDRLTRYVGCDEGAWDDVATAWVTFVMQMQELATQLQSLDDSFKLEKRSAKDLFSAAFQADESEFSKWIPIFKNAYSSMQAVKEIGNTTLPTPKSPADLSTLGSSVTLEQALEALNSDSVSIDIQTNSNDRLARYTVLYGYGGSLAGENLASSVAEINSTLESINTVHFPAIQTQVDQASGKQCQ